MGPLNEFGIIDKFDKNFDYSLNYNYKTDSKKYKLISIEDDYIIELLEKFKTLKTYYQKYDNPNYGLDRYGVTLIPPCSLKKMYDFITTDNNFYKNSKLIDLANLIQEAIEKDKFIIHFGI